MANISNAFGKVQISAPSYEDAETLLKLFHAYQSNYGNYSTFYSESWDRDPDAEGKIICTFDAFGRWSFSINIECFGQWLSLDVSNEHRKFIESIPWTVEYRYTDYEPGCEVLGQGWDKVVHQAGQSLKDVEYISGDWNDYPMTWYNIMDVMGFSIDELLEDRYVSEAVLGCGDPIDEYVDDLLRFVQDWADHKKTNQKDAEKRLCQLSNDFSKLLKLVKAV